MGFLTTHKLLPYSRLRLLFAGILVFLGFNIGIVGVSMTLTNQQISASLKSGLSARVMALERDRLELGLQDDALKSKFDAGMAGLWAELAHLRQWGAMGLFGFVPGSLVIILCFIVSVLFLVSAIMVFMSHAMLDILLTSAWAAVAGLAVSIYGFFLGFSWGMYALAHHILELNVLIRHPVTPQAPVEHAPAFFIGLSMDVLFLPLLFLLVYLILPFILYRWIKAREKKPRDLQLA